MAYKFDLSKGEEILLKAAAISAAVLGIVNVYNFYINNIWHPKVEVKNVDFQKGIANLLINGKPRTIKGDSSYLINNDWSIQFGSTFQTNNVKKYDRIEILKKGSVDSVIKTAEGEEMQSFVGDANIVCNCCGWSWKASESSPSDMYTCHKCKKKDVSIIGGVEGEWVNRSFVGLPKDQIW
jgi:Zn finger protein HypA/HybF involved in hydrogenase expression